MQKNGWIDNCKGVLIGSLLLPSKRIRVQSNCVELLIRMQIDPSSRRIEAGKTLIKDPLNTDNRIDGD